MDSSVIEMGGNMFAALRKKILNMFINSIQLPQAISDDSICLKHRPSVAATTFAPHSSDQDPCLNITFKTIDPCISISELMKYQWRLVNQSSL